MTGAGRATRRASRWATASGWGPAPRSSTASRMGGHAIIGAGRGRPRRRAGVRASPPGVPARIVGMRGRATSRRRSDMSTRTLNVLHVCDHLGWEGSRMHGVKRLFAWMMPRFDAARFNVSLVSLRKKDLSRGDARVVRRRHQLPAQVEVRPGDAHGPAEDHRPQVDRHPAPARLRRHDVRPRGRGDAPAARRSSTSTPT
ncbi:MAG: hypothetical protein MZV64_73465 [Ignavibacteriales bacterium]|nr:hypothetical protein [Ignavibacteriales bacterium]